jgi:tellurite methyltransferase
MDTSQEVQEKWNQRYRQKTQPGDPCWVLDNNQHLLPKKGRSLDVACGLGANALLLSRLGFDSHAWDTSSVALDNLSQFATQQHTTVRLLERNIEANPPAAHSFDVIVVSHFLHRPLFPALVAALRPQGLLFYQTFNEKKMTNSGPSNKKYLLTTGELLRLCSPLELVFYREDGRNGNLIEGLRDCSYYVGRKLGTN